MRLDAWLDVTCLFKTRSEAQKACKAGKVDLNGQAAKPHREVKPDDALEISRPLGRRQRVIVRAVSEQHLPKAQARELYEDVTPPPTPQEVEVRLMSRLARPTRAIGAGTPTTRERRALRRMKERSS